MLLVVRVDSYAVPLNLSLHGIGPVCDTPTKGQLLLFIMHVDVAQPPPLPPPFEPAMCTLSI